MAVVHDEPKSQNLLTRILTTDFCPWANRFVYWLKEPIGWFVVATAISCMVGLYLSPVGWTLAASLLSIIAVGIIWPLIAVFSTRLQLVPEEVAVHEDAPCRMIVRVRNRIPIPVWGLMIEGYLDRGVKVSEGDSVPLPTVGLASVPPMCQADYKISARPELRGFYPEEEPKVACSFPFGIWTARLPLKDVSPLTVWPRVYPTPGLTRFSDKVASDLGMGTRNGRDGEFSGVRDYRRGDSAKQVNWVASARTDSLKVTERSAPQSAVVEVRLDTSIGKCGVEELNRRIRIAASIIASLHQQNLPMSVQIGTKSLRVDSRQTTKGKVAFRSVLNVMASIPLVGTAKGNFGRPNSAAWIEVIGNDQGSVVSVCTPNSSRRLGSGICQLQIPVNEDLSAAMGRFWKEVGHAEVAA